MTAEHRMRLATMICFDGTLDGLATFRLLHPSDQALVRREQAARAAQLAVMAETRRMGCNNSNGRHSRATHLRGSWHDQGEDDDNR